MLDESKTKNPPIKSGKMESPLPLVTVCSAKKYTTKCLMKYLKEIFSFNYFISVI